MEKPIPSLLRHFSAPVDLHYNYSDEELALISSKDSDKFNRWEAGQQLMLRSFLSQLKNFKDNKAIMLPGTLLQSFRNQLDHSATGDPSHSPGTELAFRKLPGRKDGGHLCRGGNKHTKQVS